MTVAQFLLNLLGQKDLEQGLITVYASRAISSGLREHGCVILILGAPADTEVGPPNRYEPSRTLDPVPSEGWALSRPVCQN